MRQDIYNQIKASYAETLRQIAVLQASSLANCSMYRDFINERFRLCAVKRQAMAEMRRAG